MYGYTKKLLWSIFFFKFSRKLAIIFIMWTPVKDFLPLQGGGARFLKGGMSPLNQAKGAWSHASPPSSCTPGCRTQLFLETQLSLQLVLTLHLKFKSSYLVVIVFISKFEVNGSSRGH